MRSGQVAIVAIVAAVLGGLVALAVGTATGLVGDGGTETVVLGAPAPGPADGEGEGEALPTAAKPVLGNDFDPAEIYEKRAPGVVTVFSVFDGPNLPPAGHAAQGSGFVVSETGEILTSAHVITNAGNGDETRAAADVFVEFRDGDRVQAKIVGWDVYDDVGVIKVDPRDHAVAPVPLGDSSRVSVGEPVAAMGSPFGNEDSLAVGVVSAARRSISSLTSDYQVVDTIQTDAPITHGNSGGPLFDARGRVIGINAQIRTTSGDSEGVGFAIPINAAKRSLRQLLENGRVAYAYVGVEADTMTPSLARRFGYAAMRGAVIAEVRDGSPGARAGLRGGTNEERWNGVDVTVGGDLVVAIGGRPVSSADDLVRIVAAELEPGEVAGFTVFRDGRRLTIPVRLGERPELPGEGR